MRKKHARARDGARGPRSARPVTSARRGLSWFLRDDSGLAFTAILTVVGVTSAVLGLWGTGEAVNNKITVNEATSQMRQQAQTIRQRTQGNDSQKAQVLRQNADIMEQAADKMDSQANWDVGVSVATNVMDAATAGITSKSKVGYQAVKFVWDGYTGWQIGDGALNAVDPPDPEVDEAVAILQSAPKFSEVQSQKDPATPSFPPDSNVDGFIFQTQTKVMMGEVAAVRGDADVSNLQDLSQALVLDYTLDQINNPDSEVSIGDSNPFLDQALPGLISKVDPSTSLPVDMGQIYVSPEDEAALKNGEKSQVIGQYYGVNRPEPVIVSADPSGGLESEFVLLDDQPVVSTNSDFTPEKEEMPDWWDGTVDSCPFLYVWDGQDFVALNDIISVSRDPEREYDDYMSFDTLPQNDGGFEVRIIEVRDEESWLDEVAVWAVDVPDGYGYAVDSEGNLYSTGRILAPAQARGASPGVLGRVDGEAVRIWDGPGPEAVFRGVGDDAVLLLAVDGFEDDGDPGALLFQRPTIFVEAWDGEGWVDAGIVRPRDELDTMAVDVSEFVRDGEVRVRLRSDSCHVGKYQLLDRLALSTADSSLAAYSPVRYSATAGGEDVSGLLSAADDERVHTMPGDSIALTFEAESADGFVMKSRGWYRPLE
ncbi:MAG: hypothetical protein Kow0056_13490 [Coriobacteriia bacterium]